MDYTDIIATAERTCFACPTIYEGKLVTGDDYYVRARHGIVRFENETLNITASTTFDGDGVLSEAEFKEIVIPLWEETNTTYQNQLKEYTETLWDDVYTYFMENPVPGVTCNDATITVMERISDTEVEQWYREFQSKDISSEAHVPEIVGYNPWN